MTTTPPRGVVETISCSIESPPLPAQINLGIISVKYMNRHARNVVSSSADIAPAHNSC